MVVTTGIITKPTTLEITYEKLPDHYQLEEEPVENTGQPLIAGTLREILELTDFITPEMLIASNFGICVTVNQQLIIKAPDWVYVPLVKYLSSDRRSYTPNLEGENPAVVMEFLSETEGGEYSHKPTYTYGKWYFYERLLKVPTYIIFDPTDGSLEVYHLQDEKYQLATGNDQGLYWLESMGLYLGSWFGTKEERTGYWLRWWDKNAIMLPTAVEKIAQERLKAEQERLKAEEKIAQERLKAEQERLKAEEKIAQERLKAEQERLKAEEKIAQERLKAEQERLKAEQERLKAEKLAEYLRSQGINPDEIL
jgi:Uma2 family endonuclease